MDLQHHCRYSIRKFHDKTFCRLLQGFFLIVKIIFALDNISSIVVLSIKFKNALFSIYIYFFRFLLYFILVFNRACGQIFCDECSSHRVHLFKLGYKNQERVCDRCYVKHQDERSKCEAGEAEVIWKYILNQQWEGEGEGEGEEKGKRKRKGKENGEGMTWPLTNHVVEMTLDI